MPGVLLYSTKTQKSPAIFFRQLGLARSPLPDIPGQEHGGGGTGQTGESAGAEAQHPGGGLRSPAKLVERDAEQECAEEAGAKADAGIEPDRCP
jgi:hypothetical protein